MQGFHSIFSVLMACCVLLSSNSPLVYAQDAETQNQQAHQPEQNQQKNHLRKRELQSVQQALNDAKAKWASFAINEYIYHIRTEDFFYAVTFACRVTSDQVRDLDSSLEVTSNSTLNLPNLSPPTVNGFFDDIQKAIRSNKNPSIQVTYDATYGYPKIVNLDYGQAAPGFFFLTDTIRATVETMIPVTLEMRRITAARLRFNAYLYDSWDATYQQGQNYRVQVRSKVITSVRDESNRDVTSSFNGNANLRNRVTIANSFTEVRSILDTKKPKTFSVAYHPTDGYITSLSATFASYTNDGGNVIYSIINLQQQGTARPIPPTGLPSASPSTEPPSDPPTPTPSDIPTRTPTPYPSSEPSLADSDRPTKGPTGAPSSEPSIANSDRPTKSPTAAPSVAPSRLPTKSPTTSPSSTPSFNPTKTACVPRFDICTPGVSECCNPSDRCGASSVCRPAISNPKDGRDKLARDRAFTGIPSRNGGRRGLQLRGM
ncbi:unnamed protein product [Cylindrotheca closterium]|uniref:Uncharacterized protein n=1 Tax=Cylindrotheca closterium TaxID=2856 RepID=A0AAD2CNM5_9STRA|nr:unnamed protein product [Cylindrotheca closterium]